MSNLSRRPSFETLFDDLLKGFSVRPLHLEGAAEALTSGFRMDVKEDDKSYTVHAELPGVQKDDIQIDIDGDRVSISAEVKNEKEVKEGEKLLRSERYYGQVSRSFQLAGAVDEAGASAKYTNGVLELVLPKKAGSARRQLKIE